MKFGILFFFLLLFYYDDVRAVNDLPVPVSHIIPGSSLLYADSSNSKSIDQQKIQRKGENKKLIATILAFPIPFGVLGLHRIYLGTEPWVPVAYILTLGGAGIIATMDFIELLKADEATFASFEHNPNVFMWGK